MALREVSAYRLFRSIPLLNKLAATGLLGLGVLISPWLGSRDADACGGFVSRNAKRTPALELEQVLIIHDPNTEKEEFVRQIVFRDADEPFGFVVPTPTRPEVAKVDQAPFDTLASLFPAETPDKGIGLGGIGTLGRGAPGSGGGVTVLSQQKVGSFTAFVLAADDAQAFKGWLSSHQFKSTPQTDAWLAHYVELGFYYVAFRYDPKDVHEKAEKAQPTTLQDIGKAISPTKSETVRISFSTPVAYYPYLEPARTPDAPPLKPRALAVWFASTQRTAPVSLHNDNGKLLWEQPWAEAAVYTRPSRERLRSILGDDLGRFLPAGLPETDMEKQLPEPTGWAWPIAYNTRGKGERSVLQAFEDQKRSREGWGDVLFIPENPTPLSPEAIAKRRKLFALLDPAVTVVAK